MYNNYFLLLFLMVFSSVSAFANVIIVNGLTHIHQTLAGETIKGEIVIQNNDSEAQDVKIYQRDYFFRHEVGATYGEPGQLSRSNASWIDLGETYLTLKKKEKRTIQYEIHTPKIDTLTGTYWSVIMVEGVESPSVENFQKGLSVNTLIRYAVQVVSNVGNNAKKDLQFLDVQIQKDSSIPMVEVVVENIGQHILIPKLSIELFGDNGQSIGVFSAEKKKTYPATSLVFQIPLPNIPSGTYPALLLADCLDEEIFGLNLSLDIQ